MKSSIQIAAAALLLAGSAVSAQAGTLEFQNVTFTSSFAGNVLTLEIDAAHPSGDWSTATTLGALEIRDIGNFTGVSINSAPAGTSGWTLNSNQLTGTGCNGAPHAGASLCYFGPHVPLADNMIFKFAFTGGSTDFSSPDLSVLFYKCNSTCHVGSMLNQSIPAVPEPSTYALLLAGLATAGALKRWKKAA